MLGTTAALGDEFIDIEMLTNGLQADAPPGPEIPVGSPVNWEYRVTNLQSRADIGRVSVTDDQGVSVSCPTDILGPGELMTCTASGSAIPDQYATVGWVTGQSTTGSPVSDSDPSHYFGIANGANITLEVSTNGADADDPPGPTLTVGNPVTWEYVVGNASQGPITQILVSDSNPGVIPACPDTQLAAGTNMTCTAVGTAVLGQYSNTGTVTGIDAQGNSISAQDPTHHFGEEDTSCLPAVTLEKFTNGQDADEAPGPDIPFGASVDWTYTVTNTGCPTLTGIQVTDSQRVIVSCPSTSLQSGDSMDCTGQGTAIGGRYSNLGEVFASDREGNSATAQDPSHYNGTTTGTEPVADAGPDQTVDEGDLVMLDGNGSTGTDDDIVPLRYAWSQVAGILVSLDDPNSATPSFTAPFVSGNTTLTFQLIVTDRFSVASAPDTVDISVVRQNNPPVADAGDNSTVQSGGQGQLDGSNSFDPDGDPIVDYEWTQVGGMAVSWVTVTNIEDPVFTPNAGGGEVLLFQLEVFDGKAWSLPSRPPFEEPLPDDVVRITVVENSAPVAYAGPDQTVVENTSVNLTGLGSYDPDVGDTLTYQWTQTSGSTVTLNDSTSSTPSFTAPLVGPGGEDLVFDLVVTDDHPTKPLSSAPDEVMIKVRNDNDPPSCDTAVADPDSLWPPNHKLVEVRIDNVTDVTDPDEISIQVTGVTQDEPIDGLGDGDTSPDALLQADAPDGALVRAERSGNGNGRVYVISFTATDGLESCQGSVEVSVPHSRKSTAVDDDQIYDSLAP